MEQLRLFISVPIEPGLAKKIHKQFNQLDLPWDAMRPVLPEQMHITLKFLGAVTLDKLPELIQVIGSVEITDEDLELKLNKAVALPNRRPEVISIRLEDNATLNNLYDRIEQKLYSAGLAHLENRKFNPHITLARIKQTLDPEQLAPLLDWKIEGQFMANYFCLMQSELTPRGPIYTILQSFDI